MKKITAIIVASLIAMAAVTFVACKTECAGCNSTGECIACGGTGKDSDKNGNISTCTSCKGSGDCPLCDGKGRVKKSDNNWKEINKAYGWE